MLKKKSNIDWSYLLKLLAKLVWKETLYSTKDTDKTLTAAFVVQGECFPYG